MYTVECESHDGGLERPSHGGRRPRLDCLVAPTWAAGHEQAYLEAYQEAALQMYGPDWRTCSFGWSPALTLPGNIEVVDQEDDGEIQ